MRGVLFFLVFATGACSFVGGIAGGLAGATGHCDRRYGASPSPRPFCQEITDTVALDEFREDCDKKLQGQSNRELCPRDKVIAGCKLSKENDDGSVITDWYYQFDDPRVPPPDQVKTKEDVKKRCEDRKIYEEGASYVEL